MLKKSLTLLMSADIFHTDEKWDHFCESIFVIVIFLIHTITLLWSYYTYCIHKHKRTPVIQRRFLGEAGVIGVGSVGKRVRDSSNLVDAVET